jgi:hypothetical protein
MKAYVQRLVASLCESEQPLSRNRHFYTFANADGREALRISRRLRSLTRDILSRASQGHPVRVEREEREGSLVRVAIEFFEVRARRTAFLTPAEFELLLRHEGVRALLGDQAPAA